ncbi:MAG: hypothetical protein LBO74_01300 [Candidatus Symbiothrix sp.]|jgi:hypothetical protein|nr:hypothetical protein [Candidatus Symbiothrix sp.]
METRTQEEKKSKKRSDSLQWNISRGNKNQKFSVDQVLDAYEDGLCKGLAITKELKEKIKKNVELVSKSGEAFFKEINKEDEKCVSIFLKQNWYDSYNLICVLEKNLYSDDLISRQIYEKSWGYEDKLRNKDISLSISFIPNNEHLNFNRLKADGYFCFYGKLY